MVTGVPGPGLMLPGPDRRHGTDERRWHFSEAWGGGGEGGRSKGSGTRIAPKATAGHLHSEDIGVTMRHRKSPQWVGLLPHDEPEHIQQGRRVTGL